MQLPISSYDNEDPSSTARLVNCYAESQPSDARSPVILRKCPGLKQWDSASSTNWRGPIRIFAAHPANNEHAVLWHSSPNATSRRYIISENGFAAASDTNWYIDERTDYVKTPSALVWGAAQFSGVGYQTGGQLTWNGGTSYTETRFTDADFAARGSAGVEFLDNYLLHREPGTARFFGSDVGTTTSYTSTNFATAENQGDLLVGMKATNANLLLFGERTIEIWDAVGGSGFPFRRIINGSIDKGCVNGKTVALIDDRVLWVADDRTVRMLQGMEPVKVSNFAIDSYLQKSDSIASGSAFTYSFAGHNYYVLKFSNRCFVYDLTLGLWHERKTLGMETWAYGLSDNIWGGVWFARDANPQIYAGHQSYPIGEMAEDAYFEYEQRGTLSTTDVPMVMEWTYQPVWGAGQRVFHDRLEIVVQTGVGNSDETDPVISLEASDDGGQTWTSLPDRAMGAQGKTFQRVVWHNLGSSYQRVYRASVSAPVPVRVMSTELTARGGRV